MATEDPDKKEREYVAYAKDGKIGFISTPDNGTIDPTKKDVNIWYQVNGKNLDIAQNPRVRPLEVESGYTEVKFSSPINRHREDVLKDAQNALQANLATAQKNQTTTAQVIPPPKAEVAANIQAARNTPKKQQKKQASVSESTPPLPPPPSKEEVAANILAARAAIAKRQNAASIIETQDVDQTNASTPPASTPGFQAESAPTAGPLTKFFSLIENKLDDINAALTDSGFTMTKVGTTYELKNNERGVAIQMDENGSMEGSTVPMKTDPQLAAQIIANDLIAMAKTAQAAGLTDPDKPFNFTVGTPENMSEEEQVRAKQIEGLVKHQLEKEFDKPENASMKDCFKLNNQAIQKPGPEMKAQMGPAQPQPRNAAQAGQPTAGTRQTRSASSPSTPTFRRK